MVLEIFEIFSCVTQFPIKTNSERSLFYDKNFPKHIDIPIFLWFNFSCLKV